MNLRRRWRIAASAALDQIVSVGRALGVHCIAATPVRGFRRRHPCEFHGARSRAGGISAQAAVSAAGLPGSGAQYLPGAGAFVHVARRRGGALSGVLSRR